MTPPVWLNFLLLAVVSLIASSSSALTKKQINFIREKLKIELKKHEEFSSQLEDLTSISDCRNSIDPVGCIKNQDSYQNIKNRLSSSITKNVIFPGEYQGGRSDLKNQDSDSSDWNAVNNNGADNEVRRNSIDRQDGENAAGQEFTQLQIQLEETNQAGANETRFIFGGNLTAEEFERQKFLTYFIGPIKAYVIQVAREIGLAKKGAYQKIEPYLFEQVKYLFDKNNQKTVANTAELMRIIFNGGLSISLGIRDLFRVIYYFNDWVDDPITFDLFDALFNFGYRQNIPEGGV